jgi:hypothetical protein
MSDEREDDPFAEFERPPEGEDPFDDLERAADDRAGNAPAGDDAASTGTSDAQPESATASTDTTTQPVGASADPMGTTADDPASDPLGSLADVTREGDPFEDADLFEAVDLDAVDPEQVWEELDADEFDDHADERDFAQVSKHRFCETCEHFADPPAVGCTNDGTRIVEFPDMEDVIVVDCPVVAEQRRLENQTGME